MESSLLILTCCSWFDEYTMYIATTLLPIYQYSGVNSLIATPNNRTAFYKRTHDKVVNVFSLMEWSFNEQNLNKTIYLQLLQCPLLYVTAIIIKHWFVCDLLALINLVVSPFVICSLGTVSWVKVGLIPQYIALLVIKYTYDGS